MKNIKYTDYFDKVYGGWYGKCLGGAAGAPVEGIKKIIEVNDFTEIMNADLPNDDLDIQLLWLDVLEKKGYDINSKDLADAWVEKCWYPFSEYGYFLKNYARGIKPPYSGEFNNPFFKEGMGCPIRSEIWGFISPGRPDLAYRYAKMDGELDHATNSVWAEEFLAVIESMLFFESDIHQLISLGMAQIPPNSKLYKCIRLVEKLYIENSTDWKYARKKVLDAFGHPDFTNVIQNMGIVVIALLYGQCDLRKTINIALKCGYDSDCTCATAASIVGGILGYSKIDVELTGLIQDYFICGIDVNRRSDSIKDLAEDTCKVGYAINKALPGGIEITDAPDGITPFNWKTVSKDIAIEILYKDKPATGYLDTSHFEIKVKNNKNEKLSGSIIFENIPENWQLQSEKMNLQVLPSDTATFNNTIFTDKKVVSFKNTNIITAKLVDAFGNEIDCVDFGFAGASIWKAYGPFYEQMDKPQNPNHPSPHAEGCVLPTVECMVNNEVFLKKEYLDEQGLLLGKLESENIINAYEDLIPIDTHFTMEGQCCFYLSQELESPDDREVWVVIGNNDGFKLWINGEEVLEKDEIRLWTPYNNCELIRLKKGKNRIILKLLRRTETLKFGIGLRKFEGEHWHRKQWYTDFTSSL